MPHSSICPFCVNVSELAKQWMQSTEELLFVAHINSGSDAFEIKISIIKEIYSIKSLFPCPHQTTVAARAASRLAPGIVKKLNPVPSNTDGSLVEKDCELDRNHSTDAGPSSVVWRVSFSGPVLARGRRCLPSVRVGGGEQKPINTILKGQ